MNDPTTWLAVAAGGALGALARAGLYRCVDAFLHDGPEGLARFGRTRATLLANVLGCFSLGALFANQSLIPAWLALFLGVGVCGSLTTFSTLCADHFRLARSRGSPAAWIYLLANVALGFGAMGIGASLPI